MRTGALLGLAALAAFIYYCFAREGPARWELRAEPRERPRTGDGSASVPSPASAATRGTRFPEGDPTVRH